MTDIVKRLRTQPPRLGVSASTDMLRDEAADEIERLRAALPTEFERGKIVGKGIGWAQAKDDTTAMLAANFPKIEG